MFKFKRVEFRTPFLFQNFKGMSGDGSCGALGEEKNDAGKGREGMEGEEGFIQIWNFFLS